MEHPKDSLSPYLDGALSEEERGRVDEHLRSCADCAAHLEGLRTVSKLVSSLPRKPLPTGFLQRLNRRAAAPREAFSLSWLPTGPARMAAFAATGILVTLIAYREVRFQRMRVEYESSWSEASLQKAADKSAPMEEALSHKSRIGEKTVHAPGAPLGIADEGDAASVAIRGFKPPAEVPLPGAGGAARSSDGGLAPVARDAKSRSLAAGADAPIASNDELQNYLQEEKARMGIHQILPKNAPPPQPAARQALEALPDRPMSKKEAMAAVRQMASQLSGINNRRENSLPLVPVIGLEKPKLLASASESRPLEDERRAGKADSELAASADSIALAGGKLKEASPEPLRLSTDAPEVTRARMTAPVPAAPSSLPRVEEKPMDLGWTRSWTGTGGNKQGGFAVKDADSWSSLWNGLGSGQPIPSVDFSKETALAVFSDAEGKAVEIASVHKQGPRIWVAYRLVERKADGGVPTSPYHIVIIPRSDLPVTFKKTP
ncbi:MAG: zf-HC2 domain-containing protein [Elusimicrobiota bacterium]